MASASGTDSSPIYFYGHKKGQYNFLSQWYSCEFGTPEGHFNCAEQYMMYHKALVFEDMETAAKVMSTKDPKEQKALGRMIRGFDDETWEKHRERVVEEGNWHKFTNNENRAKLARKLLATGSRELVEASPLDRTWGIGYNAQSADSNRSRWGLNLLGKALMRVRGRLKEQEAEVAGASKTEGWFID